MDGLIIGWFGGKTHFFRKHPFMIFNQFRGSLFEFKGNLLPSPRNPTIFSKGKKTARNLYVEKFPSPGWGWLFTPKKNGPLTFGGSKKKPTNPYLVGGWTNPVEKYACQIGSFPQIGVKIMFFWNHHLVMLTTHPLESSTHPFSTQVCLFSKEKISRIKLEFIEVSSFWRFFWVHWTETSQNFVYQS